MCGRYTRFAAMEMIYKYFGIAMPRPEPPSDIAPSWNVAPQTYQPVVRLNAGTGEREIALLRWGLVPFFSKEPTHSYSTINAKAETLLEKPMFREPFRRRRCLVPIDCYFEWQVLEPGKKKSRTWAIGLRTDKPFALGGIWDRWVSADGAVSLESYSIITTVANDVLAPLHDRMPLIIADSDFERWLEPGDPKSPPVDLLRPFPSELMKSWRVKPDVGNVRNNRPDLIDPIEPEEPPMLF